MNGLRWLKIGLAAATLLALYVLAAMLLGPTLAERRLHAFLAEPGGLDVAVRRVRVDPFTLVAEFQGLVLSRPGEPPLLAAERVYAGVPLAAMWRPGTNLSRLELLRPRISLSHGPADLAGVSDWVKQRASEGQPLLIGQFRIEDGTVRLATLGNGLGGLDLERLTLTGTLLGSAREVPGEIRLEARHSLGGSLTIATQAGLNPLSARGSFGLDLSDLGAVARWLGLDLDPPRGRVTVRGDFGVAAFGGQPGLTLAGLSLRGEEIQIQSADGLLRLDEARLEEVDLDFRERRVRADRIAIDGGALTAVPESLLHAVRGLPEAGWTVSAGRIETRALALDLDADNRWPLRDVELELLGFDSSSDTHADFTVAMALGPGAALRAQGWLAAGAPALEATVSLSGLDLAALSPRLRLTPDLELDSGSAGGEGTFTLGTGRSRAAGRIQLSDFSLIDPVSRISVLSARGAEFNGVVDDGALDRAQIERLRLSDIDLDLLLDAGGRLHPGGWHELTATPLTIDRIELVGGEVTLTDARLEPPLEIRAGGLRGAAAGLGPGRTAAGSLEMEGRVDGAGAGRLVANWRPGGNRPHGVIDLKLGGIARPLLSAYAGRFAGREIESGELNLGLRYLFRGDRYRGRQRLVLNDLRLGRSTNDLVAARLPFDLAVALLQDADGRIDVTMTAMGTRADREFGPDDVFGETLTGFLDRLQESPFEPLGELVGLPPEELSTIEFEPGSAAITATSERRLAALRDALARRPALGLRIAGGYAPASDRPALARQQMRLHVALATSAGPPGGGDPGPLAFGDYKVQSVLDEFAGERLDGAVLTAIGSRFAGAPGDRSGYYRELFEALVANEPIAESALKKLARFRAQAIVGRLTTLGVPAPRLETAEPLAVPTGEPEVPVPLAVTVVPVDA